MHKKKKQNKVHQHFPQELLDGPDKKLFTLSSVHYPEQQGHCVRREMFLLNAIFNAARTASKLPFTSAVLGAEAEISEIDISNQDK